MVRQWSEAEIESFQLEEHALPDEDFAEHKHTMTVFARTLVSNYFLGNGYGPGHARIPTFSLLSE